MIRFDDDLDQSLVATAERQAESVSHIIRRACREYVHRHTTGTYNITINGDVNDPETLAQDITRRL